MIWLGFKGFEEKLANIGNTLKEDDNEISREERTASGRLVKDIIAVKKIFTINYSLIKGQDLDQLINLYNERKVLSLIIEREDGSKDTYEVRFKPFSRTNFLRIDEWYWSNVSIELEEI